MNIIPPKITSEIGLRWLFVDMNSFFASCEQQENPSLRGQPIAVAPMLSDTTCAIAASYEAKACGIRTGTKIAEAKRLCPNLKIVHARPKLYVQYHHKILEAIEKCIPIESIISIDEVVCRLDKIQQSPDKARELALSIKAVIKERVGTSLTSSIGIASNQLLAKLGSDMQKPDGLVILRPEDLPHAILHLKLQDIVGIGPHMAVRLQKAGINDIAALWAADSHRLRYVWKGVTGLRFHALLHGADLPRPVSPRRSMSHQHVLAPNERQKDKAMVIIRQLLIRVAQRLRLESFYCRRLILEIKWMQNLGYYVVESTFQETQDTRFLLQILKPLWEAVPDFKPLRIGVTLANLKAQEVHEPDLFDQPKPVNLTVAIDKINTRFGRGTISYGSTLPAMTSKIAFKRVPKLNEF